MRNLYRRKIKNRQKSPNIAIPFFMIINADFSLFFPVITSTSSVENTVPDHIFAQIQKCRTENLHFPSISKYSTTPHFPHSKS